MTDGSHGADDGMDWEQKLVGRPRGTDYLNSTAGEPGDRSPLLSRPGEPGIATQVILRDVPEDGSETERDELPLSEADSGAGDSDSGAVAILILVVAAAAVGTTLAVQAAVPKVRSWWKRWRGAIASRKAQAAVEPLSVSDPVEKVSVDRSLPLVSGEEWLTGFVNTLTHAAETARHRQLSADAWSAITNVRVVDDEGVQAFADALREMTPEQIEQRVFLMLEQDPDAFDRDAILALLQLLGATTKTAKLEKSDA